MLGVVAENRVEIEGKTQTKVSVSYNTVYRGYRHRPKLVYPTIQCIEGETQTKVRVSYNTVYRGGDTDLQS